MKNFNASVSRRSLLTSFAAGLGIVALGGLTACGGSSAPAGSAAADSAVLTVAASPAPHAEILTDFAAPLLAEQGIELKVKEYTDYIQPNKADSAVLTVAASPAPHAEILTDFAAPLLAEQGIELKVKEYTDYIQPNKDTSAVLTVAASPAPHAEILTDFAAPLLAEQGIELKVKEYTDYIQPNKDTSAGSVDANYFQHITYLEDYNEKNGTDLVSAGLIHYEPFAVYAGTSDDLDNISDGATVAIPNDPTNEGRALLLLQDLGLITLSDPENLESTPKDIKENPHNLKFQELEAAALPRALSSVDFAVINGNYAIEAGYHVADALNLKFQELEAAALPRALSSVDFAVINGNYAIEAGYHVADALAHESSDSLAVERYANIICVAKGQEDSKGIKALVKVLTSEDFKAYLAENYGEDVLPAF